MVQANTLESRQSQQAASSSGADRLTMLAFVTDPASGVVLQETLSTQATSGIEVQQGGIVQAISTMLKRSSPKVLLVDITGEEQPLDRLSELSNVLEPSVRVLVIGERQDVNFYRQITRLLGATEYLYKPLSPDMVARFFGPVLSDEQSDEVIGGRLLTVTGARGGCGATTVAVNIAWHLAEHAKRYTLLLDPDLQTGNAAMMLGLKAGGGLRTVFESPERLDAMFVERAIQAVGSRLHVFSDESDLSDTPQSAPHGASHLIELVRKRYNFVVADVPLTPIASYRDLLMLADQRVLIMEPSLISVREALRVLGIPNGPRQKRRAALVLNGVNKPGGFTVAQVEDALELKVDFTIPYLPKPAGAAVTLGKPVVETSKEFHAAIRTLVEGLVSVGDGSRAAKSKASFWSRFGRGK